MYSAQHNTRKVTVWVIDGDAKARRELLTLLEQNVYSVRAFAGTGNLEQRLARERPDLLLLERHIEAEDGLEFCRRIRRSGDDIPILMLTVENKLEDRILGFESGADDYLGKPFEARELLVRMQALLRRRNAAPAGAPLADGDIFMFGSCRLDFATRTLVRANKKVTLTSGEFSLLAALVRNSHRSLTRERLVELARGAGSETSERSIDVQISRLRKLIEDDPSGPRHIQTVWGYGYVFVPAN
jgi:two-component system phosphate regulon response regulator OmpR